MVKAVVGFKFVSGYGCLKSGKAFTDKKLRIFAVLKK